MDDQLTAAETEERTPQTHAEVRARVASWAARLPSPKAAKKAMEEARARKEEAQRALDQANGALWEAQRTVEWAATVPDLLKALSTASGCAALDALVVGMPNVEAPTQGDLTAAARRQWVRVSRGVFRKSWNPIGKGAVLQRAYVQALKSQEGAE